MVRSLHIALRLSEHPRKKHAYTLYPSSSICTYIAVSASYITSDVSITSAEVYSYGADVHACSMVKIPRMQATADM